MKKIMKKSIKTLITSLVLSIVLVFISVAICACKHSDEDDTPNDETQDAATMTFTIDGELTGFERPGVVESDLKKTQFYNASYEMFERLAERGIIDSAEALYNGSMGIDQDLLLEMLRKGGFTRDQVAQISDMVIDMLDKPLESDKTSDIMAVFLPAFSEILDYVGVEQIQAAMHVYAENQLDNASIDWVNKSGERLWQQKNVSFKNFVLSHIFHADDNKDEVPNDDDDDYNYDYEYEEEDVEKKDYGFTQDSSYSRKNTFYVMFDSDAAYIVMNSLKEMIQGICNLDSEKIAAAIDFLSEFSSVDGDGLGTFFTGDNELNTDYLVNGANTLGEVLRAGVESISDSQHFDMAYACLYECEKALGDWAFGTYNTDILYYGWSEVQRFIADCLCEITPEFLNGIFEDEQKIEQATKKDYHVALGGLIARIGSFIKPHFDNMRDDAKESLCAMAASDFEIKVTVDELSAFLTLCAKAPVDEMSDSDKEKIAEEYMDFEPVDDKSGAVKFSVSYPDVIALPALIDDENLRIRMLKYSYQFYDQASENEDMTKLLSFSLDSNKHGFATLTVSYPGYEITQAVYMYDENEDKGNMVFDNLTPAICGFTFEKKSPYGGTPDKAPTTSEIVSEVMRANSITMRTRDSWREISLDSFDRQNVSFTVYGYDANQKVGSYVGYVYAETWAGTWTVPFCYHIADPAAQEFCGFDIDIESQYTQGDAQIKYKKVTKLYDYGLYPIDITDSVLNGTENEIVVTGFDPNKVGWQIVTFTYRGYNITREVFVNPAPSNSDNVQNEDGDV